MWRDWGLRSAQGLFEWVLNQFQANTRSPSLTGTHYAPRSCIWKELYPKRDIFKLPFSLISCVIFYTPIFYQYYNPIIPNPVFYFVTTSLSNVRSVTSKSINEWFLGENATRAASAAENAFIRNSCQGKGRPIRIHTKDNTIPKSPLLLATTWRISDI